MEAITICSKTLPWKLAGLKFVAQNSPMVKFDTTSTQFHMYPQNGKKGRKKDPVTEAIVKETLHEMDVGATLRPASSNGHYRFDCFDSLPCFIDHSSLVPSAITDVTSPLKLVLRTNRERAEDRTPIMLGSKPPLLTRIARTGLGTSPRPW